MTRMNSSLAILAVLLGINLTGVLGNDPLQILPSKNKHTKFAGETFYVACETNGANVQRVMWNDPDGNQITDYKARIHVEDGRTGNKGVDLVFDKIDRKDQGRYTCSGKVDGHELERFFELVVYKRVDFGDTEKNQFLEEGVDSVVKCMVDGDPKPNVTWRRKGQLIKFEAPKYSKHPSHNGWLIVKNSTLADEGAYTCNSIQLTESTSDYLTFVIDVKVHHKPVSTSHHVNESFGYLDGVVNLTCAAEAEPQANFTWIKDDMIIEESDTTKIFEDDHKSILQIAVEDESAFGDYICKAENRLGILERVVTLEEGVKPSTPQLKLRLATEQSLRLNITSNNNNAAMAILGYKVEYKRPGQDWANATIKEFKHDDAHYLTNLKESSRYVIRAYARNAAGYSDPSSDIMPKTKKAKPVAPGVSSAFRAEGSLTALLLSYIVALYRFSE